MRHSRNIEQRLAVGGSVGPGRVHLAVSTTPLTPPACACQERVASEILEDLLATGHAGPTLLNGLRSIAGAAWSLFRTVRLR